MSQLLFYNFRKIFNTISHIGSAGSILIMTLIVSDEDKKLNTTLVKIILKATAKLINIILNAALEKWLKMQHW